MSDLLHIPKQKKNKSTGLTVMGWILLVGFFVYVLIFLFPIIWSIYTAFKSPYHFILDPIGFPSKPTFSNFTTVFREFYFVHTRPEGQVKIKLGAMYLNSVLYSLGTAFISTATCCCVGYVTAIFKWKFSKFLNALVLVIMIVPIVGSLPAQLELMRSLHLYDTMTGVYLTTFSFTGINYLIFYAAFEQLPRGFIEAGKIDGASNMKIFLKLMFPMVGGIFFTLLLQAFIGRWNDYQTAMMWLPRYPTVATGIYSFSFSQSGAISNVPMKLTGCMLLLIPILVLFLLFHKRLLVNLTMGGLKE